MRSDLLTVRISTVLFDLDHTLLDSDASEALAFDATMRSVGLDDPAAHLSTYQALNMALWKRVELGELSPNDVKITRFEQLLDVLDLDADPHALGAEFLRGLGAHGELYDDALPLLDHFTTQTIGLVTNGIGSVQRSRIQRLGLDRYFPYVAISGEVGVSKPNPAIFGHLGLSEWSPESTVMIGDSLTSDIAAGANAGMATVWFNPHGKLMTGPATPTAEVGSLLEICDVLAEL